MNKKRIARFLEFFIFGLLLKIIEDILVLGILNPQPINLKLIIHLALIAMPFAFLGEYIVDNADILKFFKVNKKSNLKEILFEFVLFGIFMGIIKDLISLRLITGQSMSLHSLGIITLVSIPFAIIGEIIIDNIDFVKLFSKKN